MKFIRSFSTVLARFLLSAVFLAAAVHKIFHWGHYEKILSETLSDWQTYTLFPEWSQNAFMFLAAWTPLLLIISTTFELLGGLLVLLGWSEKMGASLLILFLIPATILFHPFWLLEGSAREVATSMFLKNLAILGGLILVLLKGATVRSNVSVPFIR
jgi:uncharacterized membrane protein YphA (DoxX/SURF4 family)